jgi:7,8-dihydropterin-6-yl-methyl-4-(beta-D-ribofuranosyl)aminobenzene 5'-phosphate synthase
MKIDPAGPDSSVLTKRARVLMQYDTVYYTCHCTGIAQYDYLKRKMGRQLRYLSAGQELTL